MFVNERGALARLRRNYNILDWYNFPCTMRASMEVYAAFWLNHFLNDGRNFVFLFFPNNFRFRLVCNIGNLIVHLGHLFSFSSIRKAWGDAERF